MSSNYVYSVETSLGNNKNEFDLEKSNKIHFCIKGGSYKYVKYMCAFMQEFNFL